MKAASFIYWLLAACICLSKATYKFGRPLASSPQLPPQLFKKPLPITHRLSMGNSLHTGAHFGHKRLLYKPANLRVRRPPIYNGLSTTTLNQVPVYSVIDNYGPLSQPSPVKEFQFMNKAPEYNAEYRPGIEFKLPTRRHEMGDDKGAIHTIPAPNLSLADKPHIIVGGNANLAGHGPRNQYSNNGQYHPNVPVTNFGFGSLMTSVTPHIAVTSPTPAQHRYEITETDATGPKDGHTVHPIFYNPELDVTRLATTLNPEPYTSGLYVNQPGVTNGPDCDLADTNIQFGQSNGPMETNLHSSLHVVYPGTASQGLSQMSYPPQLHVGHSAAAGPTLSATQLEDFLNSFPQHDNEQITSGQQFQSQHIGHHQHGQLFQPTGGSTSFLKAPMNSYNDDEQGNKQKQQHQSSSGKSYAPGRVTVDYSSNPEPTRHVHNVNIHIDGISGNGVNSQQLAYRHTEISDQAENHVENDDLKYRQKQSRYGSNIRNEDSTSSQFYMTLPNKVAREKLAALAAAGDVNSHFINQIRKQHHRQQTPQNQQEIPTKDEPVPVNHGHVKYKVNANQDDDKPRDAQQNPQQYSGHREDEDNHEQQHHDGK